MADKKAPDPKPVKIEDDDDKPDYQEKIMFLVSTTAQAAIFSLVFNRLVVRVYQIAIKNVWR